MKWILNTLKVFLQIKPKHGWRVVSDLPPQQEPHQSFHGGPGAWSSNVLLSEVWGSLQVLQFPPPGFTGLGGIWTVHGGYYEMESKQTRYKRQKVNDEIKSHGQKKPHVFSRKITVIRNFPKMFLFLWPSQASWHVIKCES